TAVLPRTHMLLKVDVDGDAWLADVGFGGDGLLGPVPLRAGALARQYAWTYRVVTDGPDLWVLQALRQGAWHDLYSFTLDPQYFVDYEVANYYVSTHPASTFVQKLTAQRPTPEVRYVVRDYEYVEDRGEAATTRTLADDDELRNVLAESFGLTFPAGTR